MLKTDLTAWTTMLCTAGFMAFGSMAAAQSTTEEAPAEETAAPTLESQLSLGEDADAPSNELGQAYTKEVIGGWELRCLRTEVQEDDPCQMYQLMEDNDGVPVAEFSLFRLPGTGQAKAGATVIVPLETALPNQLTIQIDSGPAKRYPFAFCNQLGCYSRIGLTDADLSAFKRGAAATLTIVPALAPDQKVELTLSLDGFTASFDKSSVMDQ
ncbi:MAG: invasion associated locus B family protein [Aliishimia sp.]